jgi:hypothetical protein
VIVAFSGMVAGGAAGIISFSLRVQGLSGGQQSEAEFKVERSEFVTGLKGG